MSARPIRETYKGRRLLVKRSREWGRLESYINGHLLGTPIGLGSEAMERELTSLRGWVDAADERRISDPDAFPSHFYEGTSGGTP